ncbi:MAG: hypothetical protein ACI84C_001881 [Flavobacteriales bacterium]
MLIAQIATDGDIEVCLTFQVFPGGINGDLTMYNNFCEAAQVPTSVNENVVADFQMFPSPANTSTQVSFSDELIGGQLEILDLSGRAVWSKQMNNKDLNVDVSAFAKGLYLVRMNNAQGHALKVQN